MTSTNSVRPIAVNIPPTLKLTVTPEQFVKLAQANRDVQLERTATGELIVMPPTGSETGNRNADIQSNLTGCAAILAGLVLDRKSIRRILRRDIMRESSVYQKILQEGKEEVALNLLRADMTPEQVVGFTGLSLEWVKNLQKQLNQST